MQILVKKHVDLGVAVFVVKYLRHIGMILEDLTSPKIFDIPVIDFELIEFMQTSYNKTVTVIGQCTEVDWLIVIGYFFFLTRLEVRVPD